MSILGVIIRGILSVMVLFLLTRILGRKQIQQLTLFDYTIGISIGSIAAEMALNSDVHWLNGVIALAVYAGISLLISWITSKWLAGRRMATGVPVVLLQKGVLFYENFKKTKIDLNEFLSECRSNGYFDLSQLDYVLIESNGKMSFLPASEYVPLTPRDMGQTPAPSELTATVILDGKVMDIHLGLLGKDQAWLDQKLKEQGVEGPEDVFLAISSGENLTVYRRETDAKPKNVME